MTVEQTVPEEPDPEQRQPEQADPEPAPLLPEAVRLRVIALAADVLGRMPAEERPTALAPFARFTPTKRARLAAVPLAAALETDADFRGRAAEEIRTGLPDVAAALEEGRALPAAPPEAVAAAAYLLRGPGWRTYLRQAIAALDRQADVANLVGQRHTAEGLHRELDAARAGARADIDRLRAESATLRSEADDLRRQLRDARHRARQAEATTQQTVAAAAGERAAATAATAAAAAESRRLRRRLAELEASVGAGRRESRDSRGAQDARLGILLDTVIEAAAGLRRELALPPTSTRPADTVAGASMGEGSVELPTRGLADDDPQLLDLVLGVPGVHLVVDGYNVTKSGYGTLPLESQRARLLAGLAALAAQTGAEITCVFDGVDRATPVAVAAPRGVRLLFSDTADSADDLIRRLVRAEPPGRPIVVVSSDREVATGVRRSGARPVASLALLRRLDRG